jgi:hypothetical protein
MHSADGLPWIEVISPQTLSPAPARSATGIRPVFPVVHTPYDYNERFFKE